MISLSQIRVRHRDHDTRSMLDYIITIIAIHTPYKQRKGEEREEEKDE